jgi:Acyl carrier protein phosphodiesterase
MTKVLAVKAHPLTSEGSRSMQIFEEFLDNYKSVNPNDEVTVLDLYNEDFPEIDLDIMSGWGELQAGKDFSDLTEAQQTKIARFNESTDQFLDSDKIIIANGLWNLNIPTRLKAWIDTINVAGKTFKYTETGPVGLADGKKVLHIQANGGVYEGNDPAAQYIKTIFDFIGIPEIDTIYTEGAAYTPERADEIMAASLEEARNLAKEF